MTTLKTALLSYGMSGRVFHAPFLQLHQGFELTACWERSKKSIQQTYPNTISYNSIDQILNDASINLIVVNTPTDTHFEYARMALEAGKNILIEKPVTSTLSEATALKELAEKLNKKIVVFHNRRWDSDFKTVKRIVDSGDLGQMNEAEIHFDRYKPQLSAKAHKELPTDGNGALKDLGPHIIDQALVLFGWPEKIFADIRITRKDSLIDDWFDIILYYPAHRVRLKAGYLVREQLPAYIFHGSKGSFIKSRSDIQEVELASGKKPTIDNWGIDKDDGLLHTERGNLIVRETIATLPGNYYDFYEALYQSLTANTPLPVTIDDGIAVMSIIEKAIASAKTGSVLPLSAIEHK